ncbi:MAG: undecaprenyldiphospho-muramoylpentapeptide beta-N-acetylglucosaminyltransferase [Acidobacteriota bacterium]|mgnify:FL=1|nr:undecaprenyldiphospho-muramoylpentapeptide beta-N-acetylglucosaminyltransferase [Acidobacteriota bacterium]
MPLRVLFAGGGTGGHLFPGIAVARALVDRYPDANIVFAGTGRGLEARAVVKEGFVFKRIRSAGLVGKSMVGRLYALVLAPVTLLDTVRILLQAKPELVVGLGGYSAGPVVLLASLTGKATMLLEQNAVPGMTNRLLASFVRAAAVSYEDTAIFFGDKAFVSGNPVRKGFFGKSDFQLKKSRRPHVLVVGGSQGAHAINEAMVAAAPMIAQVSGGVEITHQTGLADVDMVREAYCRAGIDAQVECFFDLMDKEMHVADLVVCRAGATTLAEVAAAGRPSLVVPFPHAAYDHQRSNAQVMVEAGSAELIDETDLSACFANRLLDLIADRERLQTMSQAAFRLARPNAAERIVERVTELLDLSTS